MAQAPTFATCDHCTARFQRTHADRPQRWCSNRCKQAGNRAIKLARALVEADEERQQAVAATLAEGGPNSTVSAATSRSLLDRIRRRPVETLDVSGHPVIRKDDVSYKSTTHGDRPKKPSTTYNPWTAGGPTAYERAKMLREAGAATPANPGWDFAAWHKKYTEEIVARRDRTIS